MMARIRRRGEAKLRLIVPLSAGVTVLWWVTMLMCSVSFRSIETMNPVSLALGYNKHILDLRTLYPVEDPIPNPPLSNGYDTFSACMLVMDDNHR